MGDLFDIEHVAIIMDGNGRWAQRRGLPRSLGHREGMKRVVDIVRYASEKGLKYLSLYAFSTENWKRPEDEVKGLMQLLVIYVRSQLSVLKKENVRLEILGDIEALPSLARKEIQRAVMETANNDGMILNIALNYGGRDEIKRALSLAAKELVDSDGADDIDIADYLYTSGQPDPDLLIRPGGEMRLSNFLIYQMAYTELYFTELLWPDFDERAFDLAIEEYGNRNRRFGGV